MEMRHRGPAARSFGTRKVYEENGAKISFHKFPIPDVARRLFQFVDVIFNVT